MRKSKFDHYGISVSSIVLLATVLPAAVAVFFPCSLASTAALSNMTIHGRVFGKESSVSLASGLRAILPFPVVLQNYGCSLASFLRQAFEQSLTAGA